MAAMAAAGDTLMASSRILHAFERSASFGCYRSWNPVFGYDKVLVSDFSKYFLYFYLADAILANTT